MARLTADEFVEKHARRLKGASEDMKKGIERVTTAPGQQAAAKVQKMKTNINAAIDSGKWQRRVGSVPLEEWKSKMINKGLSRVASGIDEAAVKVRNFASELLPYIDNLNSTVHKMPDTTLEDGINRMTTFVRGMAKFSRKG